MTFTTEEYIVIYKIKMFVKVAVEQGGGGMKAF